MQTRLERVARRARSHRTERFNNLFHLLDVELMAMSFEELKEDRAPGVDGTTKEDYAIGLQQRLHDLVARLHQRTYRPQATRRKMIPKANGKLRPLGIPTIEDKLVQRALVHVLEQVYEEEFHPFSFGFRPGRGCHDALKELSRNIGTKKVGYVVEADIKGFFDNVDHDRLLEMLAHRIDDPAVLWLLRRFLRAGVMVEGKRLDTERGTPQGGVISPLLANVYLHYVLDEWFARAVKPQCRGEAYLVRYADDFVACFQHDDDARRFYADLPRRLGKFGLEVEPSKTRIMPFGRFARRDAERRGERVGTFDFLGFTHLCGRSRKGRFKLKWRTASSRFRAKVRAMKEWVRANRTLPLRELWTTVNRKLEGHYAYYAVSDNWPMLDAFRRSTMWLLYKWLNRRSNRKSFTPASYVAYVERMKLAAPRRLVVNLNSAFV